MKRATGLLTVCILTAFVGATGVQATQFHVATAQELQTALSTAAGNGEDDTIFLAAGIYRGNFNFVTTEVQSLTIKPEVGLKIGDVVLDGESKGRVLKLDAGSRNVDFNIENLVIRSGTSGDYGGGLYVVTSGEVEISQCHITGNAAGTGYCALGGGLYVNGASAFTMDHSTVSSNAAYGGAYYCSLGGGGVYLGNVTTAALTHNSICANLGRGAGGGLLIEGTTTITLTENIIQNNAAQTGYSSSSGGGVGIGGGSTVTLQNNIVSANSTPGPGGGLHVDNAGTVTLTNNRIEDNSGSDIGGGIHILGGIVTLSRNIVLGNNGGSGYWGDKGGGGIYLELGNGQTATCDDNVLRGNLTAGTGRGGGFYGNLNGGNATLRFVNNTVYGNTCTNGGGVCFSIADSTELLHVYNNIIWGNTGGSGKDIYVTGYGSEKKLYNNNYHDCSGLWDFAVNNMDVDPLFVDVPNGDYHLRANSLCINAGTNSAPGLSILDKDGNVRVGDGIVDIGAYEHSTTDRHPADTNENWTVELTEFTAYATAWTNNAAWPTGPNPIPIDYVTRAGYLLESGGQYHNEGGGKPRNWKPGP
jgi:hypothetical protein